MKSNGNIINQLIDYFLSFKKVLVLIEDASEDQCQSFWNMPQGRGGSHEPFGQNCVGYQRIMRQLKYENNASYWSLSMRYEINAQAIWP